MSDIYIYWKRIGSIRDTYNIREADDAPPSFVGRSGDLLRVSQDETHMELFHFDGASNFIELKDTPESFEEKAGKLLRVNADEDGLEFIDYEEPGASTFLQLQDTPTDFGNRYQILRVSYGRSRLEFVDDVRTFITLSDTPDDYSGFAGRALRVSADERKIEFSEEVSGIDLLIVETKADLPFGDVFDGRLAITRNEYGNLYVFEKSLNKWRIVSTNTYASEDDFPTSGSFILSDGDKSYDLELKIWKQWNGTEWISESGGIPIATQFELGGVIIGDGLSVTAQGKISVDSQTEHSFTTEFKEKLLSIEENANNYIHPDYHNAEMIVQTESRRFVTEDQIARWDDLTGANIPIASDTVLGLIRVGEGLIINEQGVLSVGNILQPATVDLLGGIKVGDRLSITDGGLLSANVQSDENFTTELKDKLVAMSPTGDIMAATTETLGGIIVGTRLSVEQDGTLSANIQTDNNFTNAYKLKLDSIDNDANNYVHPTSHDPGIINQDAFHRFVTDAQIAQWNSGSVTWDDILGLPSTFPPSPHTHLLKDLDDTPPNYVGGKYLMVKADESGYEFSDVDTFGISSLSSGYGDPGQWEETYKSPEFDQLLPEASTFKLARYVIQPDETLTGGVTLRLHLKTLHYESYEISECWIGHGDESATKEYAFSDLPGPIKVTFNEENGCVVDYDGIISDHIDYNLDATKPIIISFKFKGSIPYFSGSRDCKLFVSPYISDITVLGDDVGNMSEETDGSVSFLHAIYCRQGDIGLTGSHFLNLLNGDVYRKEENTEGLDIWVYKTNFMGPQGVRGDDGVQSFPDLADTPTGLGSKGQLVAVNDAADALEFVAPYKHPTTHPANMIVESDTKKFVTADQISFWNNMAAGVITPATYTALGGVIVGTRLTVQQDGTLSADVQSDNNLTDYLYEKLLNIETEANKYIHPDTHPASMIVESADRMFVSEMQINNWNLALSPYFLNMIDTPESYVGNENKVVSVKDDGTGLEFSTLSELSGLEQFLQLKDVPDVYYNSGGKVVSVNLSETGLEFTEKYTHPDTHSADIIDETLDRLFMTQAERDKLGTVEDHANNYVHPDNHDASIITQTTDLQFVSQTEKDNWNSITGELTLDPATVDTLGGVIVGSGLEVQPDGTLSAQVQTDENFTSELLTKLNTIPIDANNYVHPDNHDASIIIQTTDLQFVSQAEKDYWNTEGSSFTLEPATIDTLGGVIVGGGLDVQPDGTLSAIWQTEENFTTELKTKLETIEENANNYVHPITHDPSIIAETTDKRFVSQTDIDYWNSIESGGMELIPATNSVLGGIIVGSKLSILPDGTLSADIQTDNNFTNALKTKLDNIEENANNYVHPPTHTASQIVQDTFHRFVTEDQIAIWDQGGTGAITVKEEDSLLSSNITSLKFVGEAITASVLNNEATIEVTGTAGTVTTKFEYTSSSPSVQHDINHNLGTTFLKIESLVENPEDGTWNNDFVNIQHVDENNIRITLTEASNVKVLIIKVE